MEINQHNYEHYFLMYIDNELSGMERAAVNDFIMQFPNYANKLETLQQLKISPATLIYENKFSLYKLSEQDEQCIAYLENEMTNEEKASFENKLSANITLQSTVKQWQATFITPPTTIEIDPNFKNSLYKKSAQIKPLWATVTFKRWASVAAILVVVIGYNQFNTQNKQESPSFTNNNEVKTELNKAAVIERANGTDINATKKSIALNKIKKEALLPNIPTNTIAQNENAKSKSNSLNNKNIDAPNNDIAIALLAKEDINTKTIDETITLTKEIRPTSISNVIEEAKNNFEAITPTQVQYSNIDTDEEDRIINIANLEIDGAKFRELSRKITTLFKRNKPENDKYK
ncbi:MAG: hypothetical protein EBU05_06625 [Chitinophagia bacterium]|jgi:hypothetical protein|nr:hypothetical protein [Chitinophagia bacterium]